MNVTDVNEATNQAPVFGDLTDFRRSPLGEVVIGQLEATDVEGQQLQYFVNGRNAGEVYVDINTNELRFVDPSRRSVTSFTLYVTDGLSVTSEDITVTRGDRPSVDPPEPVNQRPVFTNVRIAVNEAETVVQDFQIIDPDGDPLAVTLEGPDADAFVLDDELRLFLREPASKANPGDADQDGVYELRVTASDAEFTSARDVRVEILGDPVVVPPAGSSEFGFTNLPDDGKLVIASFQQDVIQLLANSLSGDDLEYSIVGGEENWLFGLDSETGELRLFDRLGADSRTNDGLNNVLDVVVQVTDGINSQTRELQIDFEPQDFQPPAGPIFNNLVDGEVILVEEGRARVRDITAGTSFVTNFNTTFELIGGVDADSFTLNTETGSLIFTSPPDFEQPMDADGDNLYDLQIRAVDTQSGGVTDVNIQVSVGDVEDAPANDLPNIPSLDGTNGRLNVNPGDTLVTTFSGTDPDNDSLTYTLISGIDPAQGLIGEDAWHFTIDEQTGRLEFLGPVEFDIPRDTDGDNEYRLVVRAFDGINFRDYDVTVVVNA